MERSWVGEYQGETANDLWTYITEEFSSPERVDAYCTTVVQSSGMGKSRTVDELSKKHFVIPVCLREPYMTGLTPFNCVWYFLNIDRFSPG